MVLFSSERFAFSAVLSLGIDPPYNPLIRRRPLSDALAMTSVVEPLNREEAQFQNFLSIVQKRSIFHIVQQNTPYWMPNSHYNLKEVLGTLIQFLDQHNAPLPQTTLPPDSHIEAFINAVMLEQNPVTIDRQFELLLDITGNHVIGAGNLGALATRYMSRFADQKAYSALKIKDKIFTQATDDRDIEKIIREWNDKIAKFETFDNIGRNDGPGDSYYFWTHFFAASLFNSVNTKEAQVFQYVFEQGTEIMRFVKNKVAKRSGVVSPHFEASLLGRNLGLALTSNDLLICGPEGI